MCQIKQIFRTLKCVAKGNKLYIDPWTRNLRLLVIEVYKALNLLSPELTWNTFNEWNSGYHLRRACSIKPPRVTNAIGTNSFDFRASLAWNKLPTRLKLLNESDFMSEVDKVSIYCSCKLCVKQTAVLF